MVFIERFFFRKQRKALEEHKKVAFKEEAPYIELLERIYNGYNVGFADVMAVRLRGVLETLKGEVNA